MIIYHIKWISMKISHKFKTRITSVWGFFGITFLFSWILWFTIAILSPLAEPWNIILTILAAFAPTFAAIFLIVFFSDSETKKDFWKRVINFKRIKRNWYIISLVLFPILISLAFLIYYLIGGNFPPLDGLMEAIQSPLSFIGFIVVIILGGPLAEELGWRGYALDPLIKRRKPLKASVILWVIWAIWHLPLSFIPATPQNTIGFWISYWTWFIQVIALTVIITWIYKKNNRSIIIAIFLHFMSNLTFSLIIPIFTPSGYEIPVNADIILTILHVLIAVIIVLFIGKDVFLQKKVENVKEI